MAGIYKLIMQRYELDTSTATQGELKMCGPPVVCKMREELHNDKPAYDIDQYHSICWIKDNSKKGGRWAHANLHAQKHGIFEYKDSPRDPAEFGAVPVMSTTASLPSQKKPFLGEWVRSTGFGGPETVFTLTAFPSI